MIIVTEQYLDNITITNGEPTSRMTAGVSQGSTFAPLLLNITYDLVFRLNDILKELKPVAHGDYIIIQACTVEDLEMSAKASLSCVWGIGCNLYHVTVSETMTRAVRTARIRASSVILEDITPVTLTKLPHGMDHVIRIPEPF